MKKGIDRSHDGSLIIPPTAVGGLFILGLRNAVAAGFESHQVQAYSAGSGPSGQLNPRAIQSMREIGYDLAQHRAKSLTEVPDVDYDFVVTMGCGDEFPFVRARNREDWDIPDPKNLSPDDLRRVRNLLEAKVKALVSKLASDHQALDQARALLRLSSVVGLQLT